MLNFKFFFETIHKCKNLAALALLTEKMNHISSFRASKASAKQP
ncbi:MAG: hypothetical protein U5L45_02270 [Saprospiraceae bacterium]|nr:hypothetical protein [Saprospiraceae bacterium]